MKSLGKIRYSPKLNGKQEKWWMVIDCDPEIGRYYRNLYWMQHHRCYKLQRPAWGEHITVVRNEEPVNKEAWKKYENIEIFFDYMIQAKTNSVHYWVSIECPFLLDLREELGLPRNPEFPLHLTFGNSLNSQISEEMV